MDQAPSRNTLGLYRFQLKKAIIEISAFVVTPDKSAAWYSNTLSYIPKFLAKKQFITKK